MEYTEENDDFNSWMDIVKENYPNVEITKEMMDILFDTFAAGMVTKSLDANIETISDAVARSMH
jgi:flagellar basal body rod protein FlgC